MTMLNPQEKIQVAADVRFMIESSGETARILRPTRQGEDSFYGSHEGSETEIAAAIPCELHHLPPEEVQQKRHDANLHVLPDAGVQEGDFAEVDGTRYRVTDVKPQNCFGVITHIELRLEMEVRHRG